MPITYAITPDDRIIVETWTGRVTIAELRAYWTGFLADPEVMERRTTLADLRGAELAFTGAQLDAAIVDVVLPALQGREWLTAIVVSDPIQFGVSRQYQVFAGRYSHDAIFDSIETARAWLEAGG